MKNLLTILFVIFSFISFSQFTEIKEQNIEATWDQGIPYLPEDEYISDLTNQLTYDSLLLRNKHTDENSVKLCREIGLSLIHI